MHDLSAKQIEILEYMKKEVLQKGYPPSVREICAAVGLRSTSTVHGHLSRLEKKGYIKRDTSKPRAIEIFGINNDTDTQNYINVPIIGTVTAGEPIFAYENIEDTFPIPQCYVNNRKLFMLKIKGDSMKDAGIFNKDLVLVNEQSTADNGDIVVALIEDSATVKRFFKDTEYIRLQPENPSFSPILLKSVTIIGKVVGVFRLF